MDDSVAYSARTLEEIHHRSDAWRGVRVGVFRREGESEVQVGEYERNYPSLLRTFAPFRAGGQDLALYSPDYACTRLLELPACRDVGGEDYAHQVRITIVKRFDLRDGRDIDRLEG